MNYKALLSVVVSLLGLAVPVVVLLLRFGSDTAVNSSNPVHLIALAGSVLFSFLSGMLGSWLLRASVKSPYLEILEMVSKQLQKPNPPPRKGDGRNGRRGHREARAAA